MKNYMLLIAIVGLIFLGESVEMEKVSIAFSLFGIGRVKLEIKFK